MTFFEAFSEYFSYPFVWYALIVGVLIALCSALFGVVLVLKRFSFIGDGLSHVAFGAMSIALVLGFAPLTFAIPVVVLCAFLLMHISRKSKMVIILRRTDTYLFPKICCT